jgi:hypothetical protein
VVKTGAAPVVGGRSDALLRPPGRALRLWRVVAIILVFVAIGPVVGTAVFIVLAMLDSLVTHGVGSTDELVRMIANMVPALIIGSMVGYVIGAIPAAGAGLMVGIKQVYFGGAGWRFALGAGMLLGLLRLAYDRHLPASQDDTKVLFGFCVITTLSTLACRRVVKSWYLDRSGVSEANT